MEIWKPLARFDGIIEVSSEGRVRRLDYVVRQGRGSGHDRLIKGKLFKFNEHPWGYYWIEWSYKGVVYRDFVHRLVAEGFIGPCPEGHYVLHGDNNPKNNAPSNLRYGTPTENCEDKLMHGTQPSGERIPWSKLCETDIVRIRELRAVGEKLADIGSIYGLSEVYVWHICTGKKWPNAGGPITEKERVVKMLTDEQRREALAMRAEGKSITVIANHFGVSRTQIHNCVRVKSEDQKCEAA